MLCEEFKLDRPSVCLLAPAAVTGDKAAARSHARAGGRRDASCRASNLTLCIHQTCIRP